MSLLAVALIALAAGLTSCNKVESQIFDLSYDAGDLGDGTAMAYELTYKPIFIAEIAKVAPPVSESGTTFMLNSTEKKAKADVKAAFEKASELAQKDAGEGSMYKGLKVILQYSNGSNLNKVDFLEYTFK